MESSNLFKAVLINKFENVYYLPILGFNTAFGDDVWSLLQIRATPSMPMRLFPPVETRG